MKIDWWTVALQAVNVLVLLWLLQRFLYQPVRRVLQQRRQQATQMLDQARTTQAEAEALKRGLETERQALAAARERAEADARTAAAAEGSRLLAQAESDAAERACAAHAVLEAERHTAEARLAEETAALAVDIARRLLGRLPTATMIGAFLDGACAELQRLVGGAAGSSEEIELVSAAPLDAACQMLCRERLLAVLGASARLRFSVDPALIAGLELRLPHALVRNHWAQDLARVLDMLKADARAA
jgi:F-type H+-transporting ATPase subunit b